jgi:hypothetical protein
MEHELISRARQEGAPLLDATHSQATFVWKGRAQPALIGDFNVLNRDLVVFDLFRQCSPKSLRIWMDAGRYEILLDCNRRINDLLASRGYDVTYRKYGGGHNYPS